MTRREAVRWIERRMKDLYKPDVKPGNAHHFGIHDLRELLDIMYDGPPSNENEALHKHSPWEDGESG